MPCRSFWSLQVKIIVHTGIITRFLFGAQGQKSGKMGFGTGKMRNSLTVKKVGGVSAYFIIAKALTNIPNLGYKSFINHKKPIC
jgi:hypothetical protein